MRHFSMLVLAGLVVAASGCAGASAESPLRVKLGIPRDQAIHDLRAAKFCFTPDGPAARVETFSRCDRAGSDWAEVWVTAAYDQGTLVELRRYEKFTDDNRALERFNQMVADRLKITPEDPAATERLKNGGSLEPGTKIVKAFRIDADTLVGVYLLSPTAPANANVLEAIVRAAR